MWLFICIRRQLLFAISQKHLNKNQIQNLNKMQINMTIVFLSLIVLIASVTAAPVPARERDGRRTPFDVITPDNELEPEKQR
jgi:hypothetical protein